MTQIRMMVLVTGLGASIVIENGKNSAVISIKMEKKGIHVMLVKNLIFLWCSHFVVK